jgi:hypothetical protein
MRDAVLLQPVGDDEQLFAEALQEVKGQPTLQAETLGQRIGPGFDVDAGHGHKQGNMPADLGLLIEFDDVGMAQPVQNLAFFDQACVQTGLQGDFEYPFLAVAFDQQGDTSRAFAQALFDDESTGKPVIDAGVDRIDDRLRNWCRELIFDAFEQSVTTIQRCDIIGLDTSGVGRNSIARLPLPIVSCRLAFVRETSEGGSDSV